MCQIASRASLSCLVLYNCTERSCVAMISACVLLCQSNYAPAPVEFFDMNLVQEICASIVYSFLLHGFIFTSHCLLPLVSLHSRFCQLLSFASQDTGFALNPFLHRKAIHWLDARGLYPVFWPAYCSQHLYPFFMMIWLRGLRLMQNSSRDGGSSC